MAVTISVTSQSDMQGGHRIIAGTCTFDNVYPTGGETFNISSYLGGSPTVIPSGDDGYVIQHNRGTSAAGILIAYYADYSTNVDGALIQVANATDLSAVIVPFVAIGQSL